MPTLTAKIKKLYDRVTLRRHYRESFEAQYKALYNQRLANLIDYLDKDKAIIIAGENGRVGSRKFNDENARILICGDSIVFDRNLIKVSSGETMLDMRDIDGCLMKNSIFDATQDGPTPQSSLGNEANGLA